MSNSSYAGHRRRKKSSGWVRFSDAFAARLITIGGLGTILAVMLVVLVLIANALPLVWGPQVRPIHESNLTKAESAELLRSGLDEYGVIEWRLDSKGSVTAYNAETGDQLAQFENPNAQLLGKITASCVTLDQSQILLGSESGQIQIVSLNYETQLVDDTGEQDVESPGEVEDAVKKFLGGITYRIQRLANVQFFKPQSIGDQPIQVVDLIAPENRGSGSDFGGDSQFSIAAVADEKLIVGTLTQSENMLSGEVETDFESHTSNILLRDESPAGVMLTARIDQAMVTWPSGTIDRYRLNDDSAAELMESVGGTLAGGRLTCSIPMLGRETIICGTSLGWVRGWFLVRGGNDEKAAPDGQRLQSVHAVLASKNSITSLASSPMNRIVVAGDDKGGLYSIYVTTDDLIWQNPSWAAGEILQASFAPKGDAILTRTADQIEVASFAAGHPEASMSALFSPVWYEGYSEPRYIWQSSFAGVSSEIKLSMMPLIFGTMKATLYSMLFSAPLALLAAVYTSEFLTPVWRNRVKPIIELMASLPSVVLGFVAALVLAPYLQSGLSTAILSVFTLPLCYLTLAYLWSLIPVNRVGRLGGLKMGLMIVALPAGLALAALAAPIVERQLFAGNVLLWLAGARGSGFGAWFLILSPLGLIAAVSLMVFAAGGWVRRIATNSSPQNFALLNLGRFLLGILLFVIITAIVSQLLTVSGWDPRESLLGPYQERNALLVGMVLGFAVIPIIYTIADDALQSVPRHLRSASLGCGATAWQTTIRVVVPTAMSGLFSALMIGFGRAVGETMVVLMAAGNTPLMDLSPFNGFRTLSATLATELPEAARDSTHYRTLFLAALLLFAFTLAANTAAEFVRLRFRKRAFQL